MYLLASNSILSKSNLNKNIKYFDVLELKPFLTFCILLVSILIISGCGGGTDSNLPGTSTISIPAPVSVAPSTPTTQETIITLVIPQNQASGVATNTNITLRSSINLNTSTVNSSTIYIVGSGGNKIPASISYANQIISLIPSSPLENTSAYNIETTSDIEDSNGNSVPANIWTFSTGSESALTLLGTWESNMLTNAEKWGKDIQNNNNLDSTYYDAQRVFFQIADYTGQDEPWLTYAQQAERVYRDNYAISNNYAIPGYWRFPHGIYMDYIRTGDITSADGITLMRDRPTHSDPTTSPWADIWYGQALSREVAYAINANVVAERAGHPRNEAEMAAYIAMALNHIKEWTTNTFSNSDVNEQFYTPFMFGLTAEALISYYEWEVEQGHNPDSTIPNAIKAGADHLWTATVISGPDAGKRLWVANVGGSSGNWNDLGGTGYGGFRYVDRIGSRAGNGTVPAPDLNLLIAPAYAWLYKHSGDVTYRDRGDLIWAGGVALSAIYWSGKIFNQNYRWSFDYVKWRNEGSNS